MEYTQNSETSFKEIVIFSFVNLQGGVIIQCTLQSMFWAGVQCALSPAASIFSL